MKVREMFPKDYLTPKDFPADGVPIPHTIRAIKRNDYTVREGDKYGVPGTVEVSYRLYFEETVKYLKLKEKKCQDLEQMLGDDTDLWIGRRINLMSITKTQGGNSQCYVEIDKVLPEQRSSGSLVNRGVAGRIGEAAGQRFLEACKEAGQNHDAFLAWCKKNQPEALPLVYGCELGDIPASCAAVMGAFLKAAHKTIPTNQQTSPAGDEQRHPEEVSVRRVPTVGALRTAVGKGDMVPSGSFPDDVVDDQHIPF